MTITNDNPTGIQVVVEGFTFTQELRTKQQFGDGVLGLEGLGVADGDGALDDHDSVRIHLKYQLDDFFNVAGIEEVFDRVVVGRGGDDYEVGVGIGSAGIQGGGEGQRLLRQVPDDVLVLDWADAAVDLVHLLGHDVDGDNGVPLRQQRGD